MPDIRSVLVVDDDPVQCGIVEAIALRAGFHVKCVSTFESAAASIDAASFDFITIDLSLGDRNGVELLSRISKLDNFPRIIVVSACDKRILSATARMASELGLHDVIALSKPIELPALRAALQQVQIAPKRRETDTCNTMHADHLRAAILAGDIQVAFQPKVRLADGLIVGCEALARWHSKDFGYVPPDQFIKIAEESGLIMPLTHSVIRNSLILARQMLSRSDDFVTAINLSARLLSELAILNEIDSAVTAAAVPPRAITFEITETAAMLNSSTATEILLQLRLKGFGISIDDFGTGYSSLSMLSKMPFTELKIDRSFVKDCLTDPALLEIVRSSVELAHHLEMSVVAEGIETAGIADFLTAIGCDQGQGYLYSPAVSADNFLSYYDSRRPIDAIKRDLVA